MTKKVDRSRCRWYYFVCEYPSIHDGFWTRTRIDTAFALDDWLEANRDA